MAGSKSRLARTLRFLCDLYLGCTLVGTAGYVVWILWLLVAPAVMGSGYIATSGLWVGVGQEVPGQSLPVTMASGQSTAVESAGIFNTHTVGELQFKTKDRRVQVLGYLNKLVFSLLILGLAYLSRQFLVDVIDGRPFTFENARRLQWIGWLLLGWGLAKPVVYNVVARRVVAMVKIESPVLGPPFDLDFAWILISLFVLILSASFRRGVELEKERSLTV
jgi:hypothetical protein